jgi:hypothetical protein
MNQTDRPCPVSVQLAAFAINLALDGLAANSQRSWYLQMAARRRERHRTAFGWRGIRHVLPPQRFTLIRSHRLVFHSAGRRSGDQREAVEDFLQMHHR